MVSISKSRCFFSAMIVLSFSFSVAHVAGAGESEDSEISRLEHRIEALEEAEKEGNPHEPPEFGNPHEPPEYGNPHKPPEYGNPHVPPRYEERYAWISPLRWETDDERYSLGIRGRIQPRYSYERRDAGDRSSFTLRRIRLDFRGHAFDEALTYRIMPEMTGGLLPAGRVDQLPGCQRTRAPGWSVQHTGLSGTQRLQQSPRLHRAFDGEQCFSVADRTRHGRDVPRPL